MTADECNMESFKKAHENASNRYQTNRFVKPSSFPTRCNFNGKLRCYFKQKKSNNIHHFANLRLLTIPPCYGRSTPSDFKSHSQFSLANLSDRHGQARAA